MKKILTLIIALVMVLSLAACSDKSSEETVKESEDKVQVGTEVENEEESLEDEVEVEEAEKEEASSEDKPAEAPSEDKKPTENKKPATESKPSEDKKPVEDKPAQPVPETKPEAEPEVQPEENTSKTVGNTLLSEFKTAAGSANALGVAEKLASSGTVSELGLVAMSVEPGFLTGFDNAEITGFKEGAVFSPMIGTIPFVGYVFTLEDGVNATEFISTLKSSANLRWNICTTAEEMVAGSSGDKVFFVMCNKSFE